MKRYIKYASVAFAISLVIGAISFTYTDVLNRNREIKAAQADQHIDEYYYNVNGTGAALLSSTKTAVTSPYSSQGYDGLYSLYTHADVLDTGYYYDLYSDHTNFRPGSGKCGSYKYVGDCYNREHTIPSSWWGGSHGNQGCDGYIVRLSDGKINGMRGNYPYGECVNGEVWKAPGDTEENRLGTSTSTEFISGKVFEPMDSRKGDVARIYFYAVARWNTNSWTADGGSNVFGSGSGTTNGLKTKYLQMLLKWHNQDPVDDYEIERNNLVEDMQKNRNPFVDHPSWVDLIWGGVYDSSNKNAEDTKGGTAVVNHGKLDSAPGKTLESIEIVIAKTNYVVGEQFVRPKVNAIFNDKSTKDVSSDVVFTGFDSSTVGEKTVTATYEYQSVKKEKTYIIHVTDEPLPATLESIKAINPVTQYTIGGNFVEPDVKAYYSDGTYKVLEKGKATFTYDLSTVGEKTVTISYTEDGITKTDSYLINIISQDIPITAISLSLDALQLDCGASEEIVCLIVPTNATHRELIWECTDPNIAKIDILENEKIKITALKVGEVVISVSTSDYALTAKCKVTVKTHLVGCGGNIIATGAVLSALSLVGIVLILIKKKKHQ